MAIFLGVAVGVLLSIAYTYASHVVLDRVEELTAKMELKARWNADVVTGQIFDNVFYPTLDEYDARIKKLEAMHDELPSHEQAHTKREASVPEAAQ